jgi:hypothetical protein
MQKLCDASMLFASYRAEIGKGPGRVRVARCAAR